MIFSKPNMLFYITNQGVQLVSKDGSFLATFPPEVYDHQDILDEGKLEQIISNVLTQNNLEPGEGVIVLGDQLLYQKQIPTKDPEEAQQELDKFIDKLPFDNKNIEKIRFYDQDQLHVVAANGHLFNTIKSALVKNNWKINHILPAPALNLGGIKELSPEQAQEILSEVSSSKKYNFLSQTVVLSAPGSEKQATPAGSSIKWVVLLVVVVIILAVASGVFWYNQRAVSTPKAEIQTGIVNVTPSSAPVASPSAVTLSKTDLLVQVLNGSGVSGQANKIKNLLTQAGFAKVEVGNYQGLTRKGTLVSYKSSVPESLRQSLLSELNKSIASVSAEATTSGKFDVVVVTGK